MSLAFSGTIFLEYLIVRVRAAGADGTIRLVVQHWYGTYGSRGPRAHAVELIMKNRFSEPGFSSSGRRR